MKLTLWIEFLVSVLVCTVSYSHGAPTTSQPQYAKSIDDLRLVLGTNYKLFVAAYWRYLINTCDYVSYKLSDDLVGGYLDKYCLFLTKCPVIYETQSCLIKISIMYVRLACCPEPFELELTTTTTSATRTGGQDKWSHDVCSYGQVLPVPKIYGGYEATQGEFPWTAMIVKDGKFLCGCVIVDTTHVITAAHCFDVHKYSSKYEIWAGRYSTDLSIRDEGDQHIPVKSFTLHEKYNANLLIDDLAMLTLERALEVTSYVTPACLPSPNDTPEKYCTVAGWGLTNNQKVPDVMMKVRLETFNHTSCLETFQATATPAGLLARLLSDKFLCASNGTSGGQDSCQGDSGGPLMCLKQTTYGPRYFVFGLVSNGNGCATPGEPGLYTNLVYYLDWIYEKAAII